MSGSSAQTTGVNSSVLRDRTDDMRNHEKAWVSAIMILLFLGFINIYYKPVPVYLKYGPDKLPLVLEGWKGCVINGIVDRVVKLPSPDTEIRRSYRGSSGEFLYFTVGYYEYQRQDKEFIHYTLQKLYVEAEECRIQVDTGHYITAKKVLTKERGKRQLVTYWYDIDGYVTSNNITAKFITAIRGVAKWRTNGSIVLIASDVNATDRVETISGQQEKFIAVIYPFLKVYLNSY